MQDAKINKVWFYRYRYQIGYGGLFVSFLAIILYTLFVGPNGLTSAEIESATNSYNIFKADFFGSNIINFPYKIIQFITINIFGLNIVGIKLPSVIFSIISLFVIIKLTNRWFSAGVATFASVIALTSSQFFFLSQNGTPEILHILYPISILLLGAKFITAKNKLHLLILGSLLIGLSLYTPLAIYIIVALCLTIAIHPHLRFVIKRIPKKYLYAGGVFFAIILAPLIISIYKDFDVFKELFGIPNNLDIVRNGQILLSNLFSYDLQNSNGVIFPLIDPTSVILIGIGLFFTFTARHTSRSYLINIWTVILLFVCILTPDSATILFAPLFILTVSGLQSMVHSWYTLFPKNPYARIAGLVPVSFFVVGFLLINLDGFRLNYLYSPQILANFSQDLNILNKEYKEGDKIITENSEHAFYSVFAEKNNTEIVNSFNGQSGRLIMTKTAFKNIKIPQNYHIEKILVSSKKDSADRFYILNKS